MVFILICVNYLFARIGSLGAGKVSPLNAVQLAQLTEIDSWLGSVQFSSVKFGSTEGELCSRCAWHGCRNNKFIRNLLHTKITHTDFGTFMQTNKLISW